MRHIGCILQTSELIKSKSDTQKIWTQNQSSLGIFSFFSLPLAKCRLKFQGKLISLIHSWWVTVDVARRITKHLCCHSLAVFMSLCTVWSFIIDVTKNIMFYRNFKKEKKRGTLWKHIRSPAYQRSSISNMLDLWYGLGNVLEMKEWHIVWWKLN